MTDKINIQLFQIYMQTEGITHGQNYINADWKHCSDPKRISFLNVYIILNRCHAAEKIPMLKKRANIRWQNVLIRNCDKWRLNEKQYTSAARTMNNVRKTGRQLSIGYYRSTNLFITQISVKTSFVDFCCYCCFGHLTFQMFAINSLRYERVTLFNILGNFFHYT